MVGPEGAQDEVVDGGVRLVPAVVEAIFFRSEVNQSNWHHLDPLCECACVSGEGVCGGGGGCVCGGGVCGGGGWGCGGGSEEEVMTLLSQKQEALEPKQLASV